MSKPLKSHGNSHRKLQILNTLKCSETQLYSTNFYQYFVQKLRQSANHFLSLSERRIPPPQDLEQPPHESQVLCRLKMRTKCVKTFQRVPEMFCWDFRKIFKTSTDFQNMFLGFCSENSDLKSSSRVKSCQVVKSWPSEVMTPICIEAINGAVAQVAFPKLRGISGAGHTTELRHLEQRHIWKFLWNLWISMDIYRFL